MLLLQSIATADDAQQAGTSSQSWGGFFAKWVGWPFAPDTRMSAEEAGTSQMKGMATAGPDQQARDQISTVANNIETLQPQYLYKRLLDTAAELRRTKEELHEAKDANWKLQMKKAELERENDRLGGSTNWLLQLLQNSKTKQQESQNPSLIEDLQVLEVENNDLRMTNNSLESRITSILEELQQVRDGNDILREALEWHSNFAAETIEIYRRDLYQIRRRIIIEKTARVLGTRYGRSKGRRESFHNWSKRVKYPDWERISDVATRVIKQGNQVAHQATRAELQAAINSRWGDVEEEGYSEEAEVLQKMFHIIYDEGKIDDDDDDDVDDEFWS